MKIDTNGAESNKFTPKCPFLCIYYFSTYMIILFMVVQFETYIEYIFLVSNMGTNYTDNELVLLAIIQNISTPATPEKIEQKAKKLYKTDELIYNGPKPEFTNEDIFGRTWNQLITKDYIRHIDSKDNVPFLFSVAIGSDPFKTGHTMHRWT